MKNVKLLSSFILVLFMAPCIYACSCYPQYFCYYSELIKAEDAGFIFLGSYIQEDSITYERKAVEFKIEKIYYGAVVTPESPLYAGEDYINTDSTVWILSGSGAECLRGLYTGTAVLAVNYNPSFIDVDYKCAYVPSICNSDYFPISDDGMVSGYFYQDQQGEVTMDLMEFEGLIGVNCTTSIKEIDHAFIENTYVFPHPVSDELNIMIPDNFNHWNVVLLDINGREMKEVESTRLDLSALSAGVYFLKFEKGEGSFLKKVVKI